MKLNVLSDGFVLMKYATLPFLLFFGVLLLTIFNSSSSIGIPIRSSSILSVETRSSISLILKQPSLAVAVITIVLIIFCEADATLKCFHCFTAICSEPYSSSNLLNNISSIDSPFWLGTANLNNRITVLKFCCNGSSLYSSSI